MCTNEWIIDLHRTDYSAQIIYNGECRPQTIVGVNILVPCQLTPVGEPIPDLKLSNHFTDKEAPGVVLARATRVTYLIQQRNFAFALRSSFVWDVQFKCNLFIFESVHVPTARTKVYKIGAGFVTHLWPLANYNDILINLIMILTPVAWKSFEEI